MKKLLILLFVCLANLLVGCEGMVDTYPERKLRYKQINDLQTRMLVDDWDYVWLYNRSSNMTFWHPRTGL